MSEESEERMSMEVGLDDGAGVPSVDRASWAIAVSSARLMSSLMASVREAHLVMASSLESMRVAI